MVANRGGEAGRVEAVDPVLEVRIGGCLLAPEQDRARFRGYQGRSLHRPGEVEVEVEVESGAPVRVRMSGTARVVYSAQITLD